MNQEPDFGSLMPDTFSDLGNTSYGAAIDDYQAQFDDFDLKGPNAQFLSSNASYDEEGSQGGNDCCTELAIANGKIDCLTDLVLPEQVNGSGAWIHSVETSVSSPSQNCSYTHTSKISIKFVEMDGANPKLQWYRTNNTSDCQANGTINWNISPNFDGSSPLNIPWSGGKGATSVFDKTISPGTYYIYAYGNNLNNNTGTQELQYKGIFTISVVAEGNPPVNTGKMERSFEVTNTVTEGEELPCGVTQPEPEPEPEV